MTRTISIKALEQFLSKLKWTKIRRKAETAKRGERLFPSRTPKNDKELNFRADMGSKVNGNPEIIVQANREAENRGVREAAMADSHAIICKAVIEKGDEDEEIERKLRSDFQKRQ